MLTPSTLAVHLVRILTITSLLLLCGCSEERSFTPLHSCDLLPAAEMAALIGAAVDDPPRETHREDAAQGHWMSMCSYYAPGPGISTGLMVQPFSAGVVSPRQAREAYEKELASQLPDYALLPAGEAGGEAVWNEQMGQLTLFRDGHMFLVTAMIKGGSGEDTLALALKIAEKLGDKQLPQ